jgi:hypothetical protein
MAVPKSSASEVANKKMKGLKDHKKAQKEKMLAKRTAVAKEAKAKKTLSVPVAVDVAKEAAPAHEEAAGDIETVSMTKIPVEVIAESKLHRVESHSEYVAMVEPVPAVEVAIGPKENVSTKVTTTLHPSKVEQEVDNTQHIKTDDFSTHTPQFSMLNPNAKKFSFAKVKAARNDKVASTWATNARMVPKQPLDTVAYRKALEADLYNTMETPRQMFIRCKYTTSVDAEYHPVDEDEFDKAKPIIKCLDDNRFEVEPNVTGFTEDDMTTRTEVVPSLSLHRLFGIVKDAGQAKVGIYNSLFDSSMSRVLDSGKDTEFDEIFVKLPCEDRRPRSPVSMGHLSSIARARITSSVVSHTLESVEAEMRPATNNNASNAPAFVDPAIISCKIRQPTPDQADELAVTTDLPACDNTQETNVLTRIFGLPIICPPNLSPTSSHHSRTSSPVDRQRAHTPLTNYSATPPSGLPVWTIPQIPLPQYVFPNGAAFNGFGFSMSPQTGGFQDLPTQQHAAHYQQMKTVYYGSWDAAGNWTAIPGYNAPMHNQ